MREHNARYPKGIDRGPCDVRDSWDRSVICAIPAVFVDNAVEGGWAKITDTVFKIKQQEKLRLEQSFERPRD